MIIIGRNLKIIIFNGYSLFYKDDNKFNVVLLLAF